MNVSGRLTSPPTNTPGNATPLRSRDAHASLHRSVVTILRSIDGDRPGQDQTEAELAELTRHQPLAEARLGVRTYECELLLDLHLPRAGQRLSALADLQEARDWASAVQRQTGPRWSPNLAEAQARTRRMEEMTGTLGPEVDASRAVVDAAAARRDRALARADTIGQRIAALRAAVDVFTQREAEAFATVLLSLPAGEFRETQMAQGLAGHGLGADWLHARLEFVDVWMAIETPGALQEITVRRAETGCCEIPLDTIDRSQLRQIEVCASESAAADGQTVILAPQGVPVGTYDDPETLNTVVVVQWGRLREACPIARFSEASAASAR